MFSNFLFFETQLSIAYTVCHVAEKLSNDLKYFRTYRLLFAL